MKPLQLTIAAALATLTIPAIARRGAHADLYSCAFTGAMGPVIPYDDFGGERHEWGVEAIANDVGNSEGDGDLPGLTDTDNCNASGERTGQDGSYAFSSQGEPAACAYVETDGDPSRLSGIFRGTIDSEGEYDGVVCGTGWFAEDGEPWWEGDTSVTPVDPLVAEIVDFGKFRIDVVAGQGAIGVGSARNSDGESGSGHAVDGSVNLVPTNGSCATTDATLFAVTGALNATTRN